MKPLFKNGIYSIYILSGSLTEHNMCSLIHFSLNFIFVLCNLAHLFNVGKNIGSKSASPSPLSIESV